MIASRKAFLLKYFQSMRPLQFTHVIEISFFFHVVSISAWSFIGTLQWNIRFQRCGWYFLWKKAFVPQSTLYSAVASRVSDLTGDVAWIRWVTRRNYIHNLRDKWVRRGVALFITFTTYSKRVLISHRIYATLWYISTIYEMDLIYTVSCSFRACIRLYIIIMLIW